MYRLEEFLHEDVGRGDITSELVIPDSGGIASIVSEKAGVVAGVEEACEIFSIAGADATPVVKDGSRVKPGDRVISITGPVRSIVTAERTALNFLMRMSGIATATAEAVAILSEKDPDVRVCATRKTTPGFRRYEKKAVRIGGGLEHRFGLDDMIMIKDNHIKACGSVKNAMARAKTAQFHIKIEIEVGNIKDAIAAAEMGADIVMADNLGPEEVSELRDAVKNVDPKVLVEASGNITLENIGDYAGCADLISMGSLTHSVKAMPFSLDLD